MADSEAANDARARAGNTGAQKGGGYTADRLPRGGLPRCALDADGAVAGHVDQRARRRVQSDCSGADELEEGRFAVGDTGLSQGCGTRDFGVHGIGSDGRHGKY